MLDKDLKPLRVENLSFVFDNSDNFDFKGGKGSDAVNHILKQIADPSDIGKKVILEFLGNNKINIGTISKKEYQNMKSLEANELQLRDFLKGTYGVLAKTAGVALLEKLLFLLEFNRIKSSGVIDYLDENGRVVIFGSDQNDNFTNAKAKNLDLSGNVDTKGLPDF